MPINLQHASVIVTASGYFFCLCLVIILTFVELRKRKHLKILSWNGKSNKTLTNSTTNNADNRGEFIVGSLHYLSIAVYCSGMVLCIGGLLRAVPNECVVWNISVYLFGASITKVLIGLFQLRRYYLCFVQDFVNKSIESVKSQMSIYIVLFYIVFTIVIIGSITTLGVFIFAMITAENGLYSWEGIWCTFVTDNLNSRYATVFATLTFLFCDWLILFLFFGTLRALWIKLRQFAISHHHDHDTPSSPSSQSRSKTTARSRTASSSTSIGIEKLQWILTRILVRSGLMEIGYVVGLTLTSVFPIGTIGWCLSHLTLAFDSVVNVIMINLMLQHNTKDYRQFIAWLSKFCCCNCCCTCCNCQQICGLNAAIDRKYMEQEIGDNINEKNNYNCNKHDKKPQTKLEGTNINAHVHGREYTLDTEFEMVQSVNDQKRSSNCTVEKSYFNSQVSKDVNMVPDPL